MLLGNSCSDFHCFAAAVVVVIWSLLFHIIGEAAEKWKKAKFSNCLNKKKMAWANVLLVFKLEMKCRARPNDHKENKTFSLKFTIIRSGMVFWSIRSRCKLEKEKKRRGKGTWNVSTTGWSLFNWKLKSNEIANDSDEGSFCFPLFALLVICILVWFAEIMQKHKKVIETGHLEQLQIYHFVYHHHHQQQQHRVQMHWTNYGGRMITTNLNIK